MKFVFLLMVCLPFASAMAEVSCVGKIVHKATIAETELDVDYQQGSLTTYLSKAGNLQLLVAHDKADGSFSMEISTGTGMARTILKNVKGKAVLQLADFPESKANMRSIELTCTK